MPYPSARLAAIAYRRQLLAHDRLAMRRLLEQFVRYHRTIRREVGRLEMKLAVGEELSVSEVVRLDAWRSLDRQMKMESTRFVQAWGDDLERGATWAADLGLEASREEWLACYPLGSQPDVLGAWHQLHVGAVIEALGYFEEDSPLVARIREFPNLMAEHLEAKILDGLALGYNPVKVARAVAQATGQSLDWCTRWTRTVHLQAYRGASLQSYRENADVVDGWVWLAELDHRTCPSCIAMQGTWHPLTESLDDHWNGRCCPVPSVKEVNGIPPLPLELKDSEEWFGGLSDAEQQAILGKGMWAAWSEGRVGLRDLSVVTEDAVWGEMRTARPLKDLGEV